MHVAGAQASMGEVPLHRMMQQPARVMVVCSRREVWHHLMERLPTKQHDRSCVPPSLRRLSLPCVERLGCWIDKSPRDAKRGPGRRELQ